MAGLPLALLITGTAHVRAAEDKYKITVRWGDDYRTLKAEFMGKAFEYPRDMVEGDFPRPDKKPQFDFRKEWPAVTMVARWAIRTKGWPKKYRAHAVDLILMYACDAQMYENIYPKYIRSSRFTFPPPFLKEAEDPAFNLAEALRGETVAYEIVAKGGFGAGDYEIKTKMRIGVSGDEKTVFYCDSPDYISDLLEKREYFFAAHDGGDQINFEARMLCVSVPLSFFRGEAMRRIEDNGRYFVQRIYEDLDDPPTEKEIEAFFDKVRNKKGTFDEFLDKADSGKKE